MKKFRRILLAVDDSPCTQKIVSYTKEILPKEDISLALLTVIPPTTSANYAADPLLGQTIMVPEITDIQQNNAEQYVSSVAKEFTDIHEIFTFVRIGNIKEEILLLADEWSADIIIMGTNGRTGFDHFISGSVSESVIRKAICPVLVVPINCA